MPVQKIDPKVIFASDAPTIDKPPIFSDKTKGWDVSRANDGRPTIKEMNKVQQDTDLKILWLNENSVTPYDASIDYPDGVVTLKDGSFKQLASGAWVEFLDDFANKDEVKRGIANRYDSSLIYNSGERVVLTNGDIVKSTIDGNTNDPNVDMTWWVKTNDASQIFDASGRSQQEINDYRPTIFQLANVIGDGISNDTAEIQKAFRYIDNNKKSYIFLPFFSNNYFIDAPIVLQEPAGIIGDKSPTYNRGGGKDGWVLVGLNATHAFDLGNYRTYDPSVTDVDLKKSQNPSDTWLVRGIGIKNHPSATLARIKDGILFTSKTDGPDRSITVQEFSAYRLNRAIYVPQTTASVSSASFNVSNSNLSENNYGIYHEARSYSTLIEKNQIEQNLIGGIYGCFDGTTVIRDNMLEGQPNAITLANHPVYKSQSQTLIQGNYFELNSGDYVIKMEGVNGSRLTLRNNWMLNNNAAEYCLIGAGTTTVLENYESQLATIENNVSLTLGTKLTALPSYSINYKKTASSSVYASIRHEPKDLAYTNDPAYKPILPIITRSIAKFQNQLCYVTDTNATLYSPTAVTIGDMLEISVLLYCDTAPPAGLSVYLTNNSQVIASFSPGLIGGKWVVTTFVIEALSTQPQIFAYADIAAATGGVGIKFAAASIKNHGQVALNSKINVKPCIPKLNTIAGKAMYKAAYTGFTLAAGATKAATLHQFTTPEGLAIEVGDLVKAGLSVDLQGLDIYAEATTNSQVKVWFKNNTSGSITIADSTLRIIAF